MAEHITADPTIPIATITPANGEMIITLKQMQECVGGYVEKITLTPDLMMYVNEDGIPTGLPYNHRATMKLWEHRPDWKPRGIVGDVLIATRAETGDGQDEEGDEEEGMTLLDALDEATAIAIGVPGATNGKSYVEIEEDPADPTRPYAYTADINSPTNEVQHLEEGLLETLVPGATEAEWTSTSNFQITPPNRVGGDWIL